MSVLVGRDRAFDGVLGWSLGDGSVRAEGSLEVGDVSSTNVVDETCRKKARKNGELILSGTRREI